MPSATNLPPPRGHELEDDHAPILSVPPTQIVAVEHPMIVKNLDNALKTFGRGHPFKQVLSHSILHVSNPANGGIDA